MLAMSASFPRIEPLIVALALVCSTPLLAGPPFQTDDPEPVPFRHFEAYLFGTVDRSGGTTASEAPAFEFNAGVAPNVQLHIVVPIAGASPEGSRGLGDVELGVKYRFVEETDHWPQVGAFPMLELPTGNHERGLGNGHLWARLPLWIQKSSGPWTTYGGAGYVINRAPGMKNAPFAGWLLQRQLSERLTIGGEAFHQGAPSSDARGATLLDAGGYYTLHGALSLLFMAGHSIRGETHTVGYLGLYYTWGNREAGSATRAYMSLPRVDCGPRRMPAGE